MTFSIIIPLYNKADDIAKTLESVLAQTYQDFEIVIVDDGSTDNSLAIVQSFTDPRIRIITQENGGVSAARNRGIAEAKYNLITFLDADDLWDEDFLSTVLELYHEYPACSVFTVNYRIMVSNDFYHSPIIRGLPIGFTRGKITHYFMLAAQSDPIICSISLALTKETIIAIGGFPTGIRAGEDLLTWAKLAAQFEIAYTCEQKATFNRIGEEITTAPRVPDAHDRVGSELRALLKYSDPDKIIGLPSYIAFWHKIRVAIFLRLNDQRSARAEFQKMSEFANKNLKYYVYAFLVYAPSFLTHTLSQWVAFLNTYRRKLLSGRSN